MSNELRTTRARTPSGVWRLSIFYTGIGGAYPSRIKDEKHWERGYQSTLDWVKRFPESPTARLAHARILINHGWSIRGSGFAHTVKEENWKPFHDRIEQARQYLVASKNIASEDPEWYTTMMYVAQLQSWPPSEYEKLLDEALAKEPDYYPHFFQAVEYYLPKWGGSLDAIEQFARHSLDRTRSTAGYEMYARIYWFAAQIQFKDNLFKQSRVDWPTMKLGIDDVLQKYPDQWNIGNFAHFACLAEDREKTKELIGRMTSEPLLGVWKTRENFDRCKAWSQQLGTSTALLLAEWMNH